MEWHQLEYFTEVARLQNVSRAAERLSITQPALSRSMRRFERDLGVVLFERAGGKIRLTRAGRALLPYAERALRELDQARRELADIRGAGDQTVALGFVNTLGTEFVPELVRAFKTQRPDVHFDFNQNFSHVILQQLESGEIDLCLTVVPIDRAPLAWKRLVDEDVVVIVPRGHRLAGRRSIRLREIAGEPFIAFKPGLQMRELSDQLCEQAGFVPRIAFEGEESNTVGGFVAAGLGVSTIPEVTPPGHGLVRLRISEPVAKRAIGIVWVKDRYIPAAARAFRDFAIRGAGAGGQGPAGQNGGISAR